MNKEETQLLHQQDNPNAYTYGGGYHEPWYTGNSYYPYLQMKSYNNFVENRYLAKEILDLNL